MILKVCLILGQCCREADGAEIFEDDPWRSKEFYVKWKRWSYIHCSWDTRETLSQLGGYKRVMNYIKRQVLPFLPALHSHTKHRPLSLTCRSSPYQANA